MSVFRFVAAWKAEHSIKLMCRVLEVSRSGYHAWAVREPSARTILDAQLTLRIDEIHAGSRKTYGSPRVHSELWLEDGVRVGRKRVERLMRAAGLSGQIKRRRGKTTITVQGVRTAPDLVERDFDPKEPNRLWCADITYIRTYEGWLYLASVMDCYSRRIVGWALADHLRAELVTDALEMAVAHRRPKKGLVHHSDQGCQYTSLVFTRRCRSVGIDVSMGSKSASLAASRLASLSQNMFTTITTAAKAAQKPRVHRNGGGPCLMLFRLCADAPNTPEQAFNSSTLVARRVRRATGLHRSPPPLPRLRPDRPTPRGPLQPKTVVPACSSIKREDVMSKPTFRRRVGRAGIALAVSLAFVAIPAAAQAAAVNLATASPFVVLAGSTVTNTGPSVLNGDLGVAPGTALVGFGLPAVVNGATHANDGVANNAKSDLTTAYNVAAGQPVLPANDLTGTDLGNRTLNAGAYRYTSSAQLTGPLTLDAQGDPNAQFVFEIASELTTASASSVVLINGASPCNVYWQVGSSATLGTTTAFQGNLMALTSISLNNGATVIGRMLARNGQVSLINNVLDNSRCTTGSGNGGTGNGGTGGNTLVQRPTTHNGTAIGRRAPFADCTDGFSATVRGHLIARVVFRMDGRVIGNRKHSPFKVFVRAASGNHIIRARVSFKDLTRAKTIRFRYRACAAQVRQPRRGPGALTG